MTSSGAISATNKMRTRRKKVVISPVPGLGMLGCTATQVHVKIVMAQLHMMFDLVRKGSCWVDDGALLSARRAVLTGSAWTMAHWLASWCSMSPNSIMMVTDGHT